MSITQHPRHNHQRHHHKRRHPNRHHRPAPQTPSPSTRETIKQHQKTPNPSNTNTINQHQKTPSPGTTNTIIQHEGHHLCPAEITPPGDTGSFAAIGSNEVGQQRLQRLIIACHHLKVLCLRVDQSSKLNAKGNGGPSSLRILVPKTFQCVSR